MIRNVFGKALTESTLLILPEYKDKIEIKRQELAKLALALKNTQGKGKDEAEVLNYLESLRMRDRLVVGWIYNATGAALTLVGCHHWQCDLISSNLYPVEIENGQWGLFVFEPDFPQSSGAVIYEGLDSSSRTCDWCVAWKLYCTTAQVNVKIESGFSNKEKKWNIVYQQLHESGTVHSAKHEGLRSVISTSQGLHIVYEALLALDQSSTP